MKRRKILRAGLQACALAGVAFVPQRVSGQTAGTFRFGTTPVFLDDRVGFLARWAQYLSGTMGVPVEFVQRRSYRDIMALLRADALDAAWICGFPWVVNKAQLHGVSIPQYRDGPWYRSYLIVPDTDTRSASLLDMRAKVFAYSDPDSNSGYLVPRTTLLKAGADPDQHFSRSFFTWGHRNVIQAVAAGLAQGGSVDGYVWDTLQQVSPALVAKTRVAWRSDLYGFPPIAARSSLHADTEQNFRTALLGMASDSDGRGLLAELNLTGFGSFRAEVFDGIAQLVALTGNPVR